jgi:1-acyl-sn-glycerol-3-phosphate acyltransferase
VNVEQRKAALKLARRLLPAGELERLSTVPINDVAFGFDPFGLEKESALLGYVLGYYVHRYYFRVESAGHENIPQTGRALITPNHSGVLPIDGGLIWVDLLRRMNPPRLMRAVVDNFAGFLPFVNTLLYRTGQVIGHRRNFQDLLEREELVTVFPEGAKGTGKPFRDRYKLIPFNVGFIELALTYRAPIVPTAIIGGEEQAPMLYDIKPLARLFGFPYFPVTPFFPWLGPLGMLPLPVKYHIRYGEPLNFHLEHPPSAVNDPELIRRLADQVQQTVESMIAEGLAKRRTVFGKE